MAVYNHLLDAPFDVIYYNSMTMGSNISESSILKGLWVVLFAVFFGVGGCPAQAALDVPLTPEMEAVTIVDTSPVDRILQFFLKEIARHAHGESRDPILVDSNSFDVFFENFKYKPDSLVERIPLARTPNVGKIIRASLKAIQPYNHKALLTPEGDYFLCCDTLRGPQILAITRKPLSGTVYQEQYQDWTLSILTLENFSLNILMNENYLEPVLLRRDFMNLLTERLKLKDSSDLKSKALESAGFFVSYPEQGYDVSSITEENQFFATDMEKQSQLYFLNLPLVQFTEDQGKVTNFFFDLQNVDYLRRVLEYMPGENHNDLQLKVIHQTQLYIASLGENHFSPSKFEDQIQNFLDREDFSLNYDAIAREKSSVIYTNIRNFLLSQGVTSFVALKRDPKLVETIVEKFFVLGTTYFYRSWTTTREFMDYLGPSQELAKEEGRPLKLKIFACSTGEEVLTFALQLLDAGIDDFRILGTDINPKFIEYARAMIYKRESFERLPADLRKRILKKYFRKVSEGYVIKDPAFFQERIRYEILDITRPFPKDLDKKFLPPYDLISCQNIFLYLNRDTVPSLYKDLYEYLSDWGQFIVVDKIYNHRSLMKNLSHNKQMFINDHLIQSLPKSTPPKKLVARLRERIDKTPTFASVNQYISLVDISPAAKTRWLKEFLRDQPGNHALTYTILGGHLIAAEEYEEARKILTEAIYVSPYLLNNYKLLAYVEKKLQNRKKVDYLNLVIRGTELIYKVDTSQALQQALNLYQGALKLVPDELLGYYVLGYQFLRRGVILKGRNAVLIDYERFLNQAFKNLHYVRRKDPDQLYAERGIAHISELLAGSYIQEGKKEMEQRLIYNALVGYEEHAMKSTDFTVLNPLAGLLARMGPIYHEHGQSKQGLESLEKSIKVYQNAEKCILNYKPNLIYDFYVDYARAYVFLNRICQESDLKASLKNSNPLEEAQRLIDQALAYNTVYGLEAIELRQQILELDPVVATAYEGTFAA